MRYTSLPIDLGHSRSEQVGFGPLPRLAAEQRESLCRGFAFFFVLALSCLLIAYAPILWGDPDWAAAGVLSTHAGSAGPLVSHARTSASR